MDRSRLVIARCQGGANAGIHAAAQEDNRALSILHHCLDVVPN
jgi:adenylosuccinate synthase